MDWSGQAVWLNGVLIWTTIVLQSFPWRVMALWRQLSHLSDPLVWLICAAPTRGQWETRLNQEDCFLFVMRILSVLSIQINFLDNGHFLLRASLAQGRCCIGKKWDSYFAEDVCCNVSGRQNFITAGPIGYSYLCRGPQKNRNNVVKSKRNCVSLMQYT
jgi:hypothetical protein